MERVTVTLPAEVIRDIDRLEGNRSRFVLRAVREELKRRRRQELRRSLRDPNPEILEVAEKGLAEWAANLPLEDAGSLVDPKAGNAVRWIPGHGWIEVREQTDALGR